MKPTITDAGVTWTHAVVTLPGTVTYLRQSDLWVGDYTGLTTTTGDEEFARFGYAAYGNNSAGVDHISFARFSVP